jgi:hypothetical protein
VTPQEAKKWEAEHLITSFRTLWDIYIKWFTVLMTINIAAIAWLATKVIATAPDQPIFANRSYIVGIATLFVIQNLLSIVTSVCIAVFSGNAHKALGRVLDSIEGSKFEGRESMLPRWLAVYGAIANAIGLMCIVVIWIIFMLQP